MAGVCFKEIYSRCTPEEQGRGNGSNTLKSHQDSQQDAFPREIREMRSCKGIPGKRRDHPPSPGLQEALSSAERDSPASSVPGPASQGHPGAWPVAVLEGRALWCLKSGFLPLRSLILGFSPQEEEGSGKSSCLHSE